MGEAFLLTLGDLELVLLTVELLCSRSVKVLIRRIIPLSKKSFLGRHACRTKLPPKNF